MCARRCTVDRTLIITTCERNIECKAVRTIDLHRGLKKICSLLSWRKWLSLCLEWIYSTKQTSYKVFLAWTQVRATSFLFLFNIDILRGVRVLDHPGWQKVANRNERNNMKWPKLHSKNAAPWILGKDIALYFTCVFRVRAFDNVCSFPIREGKEGIHWIVRPVMCCVWEKKTFAGNWFVAMSRQYGDVGLGLCPLSRQKEWKRFYWCFTCLL